MAQNPIWKIVLVLILVAIIFSFWGGERDQPDYALGIVKETYQENGNQFSRTMQAALTIAFNEFFSRKELDFSLQIEFITFEKENDNLRKNTEEFLKSQWETLAIIGSTDPSTTLELAEIAEEFEVPLLSPFFPVEPGQYSFSLAPHPEEIAISIKEILSRELNSEEAIILGDHPGIKIAELENQLEILGIITETASSFPRDHLNSPLLVLDPSLLENTAADKIFILPENLETLPESGEVFFAVLAPPLTIESEESLVFFEEYKDVVGTPDYFAFNAYDSLYFILEILNAAGAEPPNMQKSFFFFETTLLGGPTSFSEAGRLEKPLPRPVKVIDQKLIILDFSQENN